MYASVHHMDTSKQHHSTETTLILCILAGTVLKMPSRTHKKGIWIFTQMPWLFYKIHLVCRNRSESKNSGKSISSPSQIFLLVETVADLVRPLRILPNVDQVIPHMLQSPPIVRPRSLHSSWIRTFNASFNSISITFISTGFIWRICRRAMWRTLLGNLCSLWNKQRKVI